jgi:lipase
VSGETCEQPDARRVHGHGVSLGCVEWRAGQRGQGPSVLLVHATGFHARVWDPVVHRLPGRHVWAIDQRGHGRSDAVPFEGWETFGRDLAVAAAELGLQGAVGVGHSMGAHALVQAAAFAPGRFARLLLIDPVILDPAAYHLPPPPPGQGPPAAGRKNHFDSVAAMVERFAQRPPYALFDREALLAYCQHALRPSPEGHGLVLACAPAFEAGIYAAARRNPGVYASIRALQIPVQVVRASYPAQPGAAFDPAASPTWPGLAAEFRHGSETHLPEHHHLVPMQDPALVARLIGQVIAGE